MFNMKCQVTSDTPRKVMISREVKVASYEETCGGEKIRVNIGYNNDPRLMMVKDNKLLEIPAERWYKGRKSWISQDWEVFPIFFSTYNIEPIWLDCGFSWGRFRNGAWTGCVGKVYQSLY